MSHHYNYEPKPMNCNALIGVDIGTQGTKAALFSSDGIRLAYAFVPSKLHQPSPGVVEEDPEDQFASVCETISRCIGESGIDPKSIAAVAIDGQMAGIIGVGDDGFAVTPYDSWLDTRCAPYIAEMTNVAGDEILARTGCAPSFNHGPKILWWMHERSETFRSIRAFVQPGGYAAMRLCGLDAHGAFIDTTYLHFSGFADNANSRWDAGLASKFDLDLSKLPAIVNPYDVIGEVSELSAAKCGLRAGTPVVAGCGDTAASFLACGATAEGICVDIAGTASVFATTTSSFRPDITSKVLACGHSATPGLWHPYAYINGGGMNLEWFRRELANLGGARGTELSFDDLQVLAETVSADDDLPIFIPHFGGRVCPSQPGIRGAWIGLNWNSGVGHLYRAVLESVALEYGIYQSVLMSLYADLAMEEIRVTGGGEKSALWNTIKADVLQIPVVQMRRSEGAPLGSALLAGYGVGVFADLSEAAGRWIEAGNITPPNRDAAGYYQRRLDRYSHLLSALAQSA